MDTYYDMAPKVIQEGEKAGFRIYSCYEPFKLKPGENLELKICSFNNFKEHTEISIYVNYKNEIYFNFLPLSKGEYSITFSSPENLGEPVLTTSFYVVSAKLSR